MDVRALLLGSKLRVAGTVVASLALVVAGAYLAGAIGVPSVVGVDNSFGTVNESTTVIQTNLTVHNPNPVGLTLGGLSVNYTVGMNDVEMATGEKNGIGVGAGNSTITFETYMDNKQIPRWWASHLQNGERTDVTVEATARSATLGRSITKTPVRRTIQTDLLGSFNSTETRPVNASMPLVADPVLYINETAGWWGDVSAAQTPVTMEFEVYNPKPYPITVSELGYGVTMAGVEMGDGATDDEHVIEPRTTETIRTTVVLDNSKLDEWWVAHLQNDQRSMLVVDFYAQVSVEGTTIRFPLDAFTHRQPIETDIFGGGGGDGGDTGDQPGGTTTDGSDSTTTTESGSDTTTGDDSLVGGDTTTERGTSTTSGETTTDGGLLAVDTPG